MAVHVVRDTGGDWRTALANSFLAPLMTGLVNNHFEGLRTAKENALLGELANAAGNMPNTMPEQGNGFAGQFTPSTMMPQNGQGGGLNQLFSVLGNPRFKSVNAARAMELAKPWLTEQFYNGFNPSDTAQMMRGIGMGYVPKEAASYYSDMYKYQNPHQQFQNMNLGDRMVYGGFNPATGQFTQGGSMAVGMNPYQAGSLANDRQRIANDYALGVRRDDTSRYGMDLQNQQFGATMDYNREGRESDNAFRDRQQTYTESTPYVREGAEDQYQYDRQTNEWKPTQMGVRQQATGRGTSAYERMNEYDRITLKDNQDAIPKMRETLANLTIQKEAADDPASKAEYQAQIDAINADIKRREEQNNAIINRYQLTNGLMIDPNTGAMTSVPQETQEQKSADNADKDYYSKISPKLQGILQKYGRKGTVYERRDNKIAIRRGEFDKIVSEAVKNGDISGVEELVNELKSAGIYITKETAQPQGTGTADAMNAIGGKTAPNAEAKPQRTDTAAAMKAIGDSGAQRTKITERQADVAPEIPASADIAPKAVPINAPWTEIQMKNWDRMPWLAPNAYKEWKAQNGGR